MAELLKLHIDLDEEADASANAGDQPLIRTYRPGDWMAVRRLYSDGLLQGRVDPDESTRDLDDPIDAYFSHPDDRLWVAEWRSRIVGMIGVVHIGYHVAHIRRLRVDRQFRHTQLPVRLLRVILNHCRRCGDLKLVVDTHADPQQAVAACRDSGFQFTRQLRHGRHAALEFYLNLYQQPRVQGPSEQPTRAPRPPRLDRLWP